MDEIGEDTKVVVARMLKRRRSMRLPVLLGSAAAVAFAVYMGLQFGHDHRHELQVEGPVDPDRAHVAAPPPAMSQSFPAEAAPRATTATVAVTLPADAALSLDGQPVPGGGSATELTLAPGKHVLLVRAGGRTLVQRLEVAAGESYAVRFGDRIEVTKH